MNQVCALSQLGRCEWDGFDMAPPSKEDCIRAIENLDPDYKGNRNVIRPLKINHRIAKL